MKRGIIYAAVHRHKYLSFAIRSAISLRKVWPDMSVSIFTELKVDSDVFDHVIRPTKLTRRGFLDSVRALQHQPYDRVVMLDSDTYVYEPFPEIFDTLDKIDVMATLSKNQKFIDTKIPYGFYELSTGFVAIKKSPRTTGFIDNWVSMMTRRPYSAKFDDQAMFRTTLYNSENIRFAVLPDEYNFRPRQPCLIKGKVRVIHTNLRGGKDLDWAKLGKKLNRPRKKKFLFYVNPNNMKDYDK
jgi:hypothetical protein